MTNAMAANNLTLDLTSNLSELTLGLTHIHFKNSLSKIRAIFAATHF